MEPRRSLLVQGDCLDVMRALEDRLCQSLRMIYIDPPFFSGTDYTLKKKGSGSQTAAPSLEDIRTYSDKWTGGLQGYLDYFRPRLLMMRSLLRPDGCIWVHLDWHICHYMKVLLDETFGYGCFVNEIIWKRTNSPKGQSNAFGSQHDVILLYARDRRKFVLRPVFRDHDERSLVPYSYRDERGLFRLIEIEAQGIQRSQDRRQFEWRGRTAPYLYSAQTLDRWADEGLIYRSRNGRYSKKQYLSDSDGVPVSDLWMDIPPLQGSSSEYLGFVTQKPEPLLSRMISCATDEGDLVADFFCGSGTTAVVAERLHRRWIACDISETAIELTVRRLREFARCEYALERINERSQSDDTRDDLSSYSQVDSVRPTR
ncbi:MAG: site-specific DNA-methyltransferase [Candidatus Thorarchaeota archaeon]|nr:site-specific DNA-methyltransferase [Candidatus Thorarchaeota archaeon]